MPAVSCSGFAVGVLSLRATQSGSSMISAAIPVLLLALPILDTLNVMTQRISEGRSPFSADKNHIHHKLLSFGFDHHEAVMVIYAIQADLFLLAYWMRYESDLTILAVVSLFFVGAIILMQVATRRHWRFRSVARRSRGLPAREDDQDPAPAAGPAPMVLRRHRRRDLGICAHRHRRDGGCEPRRAGSSGGACSPWPRPVSRRFGKGP